MGKNDKQILKQYIGGSAHDVDWYDVVDELEELDNENKNKLYNSVNKETNQ